MKCKIRKFIISSFISGLLAFNLSGCNPFGNNGEQQQSNLPVDEQIAVQKQNLSQEQTDAFQYTKLNSQQLNNLKDEIISFHNEKEKTVEQYEELRDNMKNFAYNASLSNNAEAIITDMQKSLISSRFKRQDKDGDGISDYIEMMVSGTSPLIKNSEMEDRLDSQIKYNISYVIYISQSGEKCIVEPEFAKVFYEAIRNNVIKPLDGQFAVINLRVLGSELDGVRLTINDNANDEVSSLFSDSAYIYPLTFKVMGLTSSQVAGGIDIEHKDYTAITNEASVLIIHDTQSGNCVDYLARTPTSTSLPPNNSVYINKNYTLVFPKVEGFTDTIQQAFLAANAQVEEQKELK